MKLAVLKNNVPLNEISVDTTDSHEKYEIFVGRADDCHVQIDDPLISRHHFVLKNDGQGWICQKLSQLGNVLVNGSIQVSNRLTGSDEIKFGAYTIYISELSTSKVAPVAAAPSLDDDLVVLSDIEPIIEEVPDTVILSKDTTNEPEPVSLEEDALGDTPVDDSFNVEANDLGGDSFGANESLEDQPAESFGEGGELSTFDGEGSALESLPNEGEDERTQVFKAFVNYQLVLFGDNKPYDRYLIESDEVTIGRESKHCQIVLDDHEVSSKHAKIKKSGNDITLEDLNSSNGTILNGERINKAHLSVGDEFIIGSTTFTLEVRSDVLDSESERLMPVESNQVVETEEIVEEEISAEEDDLNFAADAPLEKSIIKRIWKNPEQRKKAIYALAGGALLLLLFYEDKPEIPKPDPKAVEAKPKENEKKKLQLSKEMENRRNVAYELGVSFFEQNKYFEALKEFQTVVEIDPEYKKAQTYLEQTKLGMKRLEELETQRRAEEERIKTKKLIEELLVKAREAVKERQVQVAESYFSQITEKDPENIEVQQLKLELESWQKEQERIALEKAAKEAKRKAMVDALTPGKTFYLKKEWYRAILKLEEFLRRKESDEDLIKEASDMLSESKNQLASELGPLLGKARSLKEGQDFKSAYEAYQEILKVEPTNAEALNEIDEIKTQLDSRSKKIYREAIIAESLSLFNDAKEKFQEVQQISPTDSEYYKKASDKLKNYLE